MKDFLAVGNEELEGQPEIKKGDMFDCPHCPDKHVLECGTDPKNGKESTMLLFYRCGDKTYLAGLNGKLIPFHKRGEN